MSLGFAISVALSAHLAFSRLGFSPTDEGFILAQSRRLLLGEVPHRDFITIRPAGSPLLHIPELLAGDHAFLVSRLVFWIEIAVIQWAWLEIARRELRLRWSLPTKVALLSAGFMLSSHTFPAMAWHTVDGIALASLGFLLLLSEGRSQVAAGYALIGLSALCKQSFLPLAPLAVVGRGHWRRVTAWLMVLSAPIIYLLTMAAVGAWRDTVEQLSAQTGLLEFGVKPIVTCVGMWVGGVGGAVLVLIGRAPIPALPANGRRIVALAAVVVLILLVSRQIGGTWEFLNQGSFWLLGVVLGIAASAAALRDNTRLSCAALALGCTAVVSIGYHTPALASGPLLIVIFAEVATPAGSFASASSVPALAASALVVCLLPHWRTSRLDNIYHEAPRGALTERLDGVFPGAAGIRTNRNTRAVLEDLRVDISRFGQGRRYCILVDAAGYWALAHQRNPLPSDWPQAIELCTPGLRERFSRALLGLPRGSVVLVQKDYFATLPMGFQPIEDSNPYYGAVAFARANLKKTGESRWWDLYR